MRMRFIFQTPKVLIFFTFIFLSTQGRTEGFSPWTPNDKVESPPQDSTSDGGDVNGFLSKLSSIFNPGPPPESALKCEKETSDKSDLNKQANASECPKDDPSCPGKVQQCNSTFKKYSDAVHDCQQAIDWALKTCPEEYLKACAGQFEELAKLAQVEKQTTNHLKNTEAAALNSKECVEKKYIGPCNKAHVRLKRTCQVDHDKAAESAKTDCNKPNIPSSTDMVQTVSNRQAKIDKPCNEAESTFDKYLKQAEQALPELLKMLAGSKKSDKDITNGNPDLAPPYTVDNSRMNDGTMATGVAGASSTDANGAGGFPGDALGKFPGGANNHPAGSGNSLGGGGIGGAGGGIGGSGANHQGNGADKSAKAGNSPEYGDGGTMSGGGTSYGAGPGYVDTNSGAYKSYLAKVARSTASNFPVDVGGKMGSLFEKTSYTYKTMAEKICHGGPVFFCQERK